MNIKELNLRKLTNEEAASISGGRNLISRTLRLNQVRAENAALFLSSQGQNGGIGAQTDGRLNSITLVGEPRKVELAI